MSVNVHHTTAQHPQAALEGATLSSDYCLLMIDYWGKLAEATRRVAMHYYEEDDGDLNSMHRLELFPGDE